MEKYVFYDKSNNNVGFLLLTECQARLLNTLIESEMLNAELTQITDDIFETI